MNKKTITKIIILLIIDIAIFCAIWLGISSLYDSASLVAVGLIVAFIITMVIHIFASVLWFKDYIKEFHLAQEVKNESR